MMKRVSLSHIKTNLVGRRRDSEDSKIPLENGVPVRANSDDSEETFQSASGEVISSRKGMCRGNNIFNAIRYKWKKKKATKCEDNGARSDCSKSEESVSKKLRSKFSISTTGKRVVCPMPPSIQCIDLQHEPEADSCNSKTTMPALHAANNNNLKANAPSSIRQNYVCDEPSRETVECDDALSNLMSSTLSNAVLLGQKPGSLTRELFKLSRCGWYWGPITRSEAEEKLHDQPDGAFLVRDSSDDRYILSLSFRSCSNTLHTRIEHSNGLFSFYAVQHQPQFNFSENSMVDSEGRISIVSLIEESMSYSQSGVFCYSRGRTPDSPSYPVRLTKPVSRFNQVRTLQYLCRFVIRQITRFDHIQKLPLPNPIKGYLEESHY